VGGSLVISGSEVKLPDFPEKKWSRNAGGWNSRSYRKNDQAWVAQRDGLVVWLWRHVVQLVSARCPE